MKDINKNSLLEGNISSVILKMAMPLMGTAFIQMAYTIIDLIWLGRLSTGAVSAVGTVGFFVWITEALILIGKTGVSVGLAQAYGRGDEVEAEEVMRAGGHVHYFICFFIIAIYLLFGKSIVGFYKLSSEVFEQTMTYYYIVTIGYIFSFTNTILVTNFSAKGNSVIPFKVALVALIFNIVFDPILIFGLGPFPRLEVAGAALATVLAKFLATLLYLYFAISFKMEFVKTNYLKVAPKFYYKKILKLGIPASSQSMVHAIAGTILNKYIAICGEEYIAVYSIGSQIESITWLTSDGIATAFSAFMGQNFGAGNYERIKRGRKIGLNIMYFIGLFGTVILFIFAKDFFKFFVPQDIHTQIAGAQYLKIISPSEFFMCLQIGTAGMLNGLGLTKYPAMASTICHASRVPLAIFLMTSMGILGIWTSMSLTMIFNGLGLSLIYAIIRKKTDDFKLLI